MAGHCPHCSHVVPAFADRRLPPWCPRCGGDFKTAQGSREKGSEQRTLEEAHPASIASERSQRSWREPTAPSLELPASKSAPDESLTETIERVRGSHSWYGIARLEYEEDFTFGTGRVLLIHMADSNRERTRIADEVTQEQLAETVAAWGKRLEVTATGDFATAAPLLR
jgi:hypothetical protein